MTSNKLSEGVGKKIVEALKKQSEIEITAIPREENLDDFSATEESLDNFCIQDEATEEEIVEVEENDFLDKLASEDDSTENNLDMLYNQTENFITEEPVKIEEEYSQTASSSTGFESHQKTSAQHSAQHATPIMDTFGS